MVKGDKLFHVFIGHLSFVFLTFCSIIYWLVYWFFIFILKFILLVSLYIDILSVCK